MAPLNNGTWRLVSYAGANRGSSSLDGIRIHPTQALEPNTAGRGFPITPKNVFEPIRRASSSLPIEGVGQARDVASSRAKHLPRDYSRIGFCASTDLVCDAHLWGACGTFREALDKFQHVVVRFGPHAAYLRTKTSKTTNAQLFYVVNPGRVAAGFGGVIRDFTLQLGFSIAWEVAIRRTEKDDFLDGAIKEGLGSCAELERLGYSLPVSDSMAWERVPCENRNADRKTYQVHHVTVPLECKWQRRTRWTILGALHAASDGVEPKD